VTFKFSVPTDLPTTRDSNKITDSLNDIMQAGKTMDSSSMFPVPVEMLKFLDETSSNPEQYLYPHFVKVDGRTVDYAKRITYLQVLH
jgi:hypothetical protein